MFFLLSLLMLLGYLDGHHRKQSGPCSLSCSRDRSWQPCKLQYYIDVKFAVVVLWYFYYKYCQHSVIRDLEKSHSAATFPAVVVVIAVAVTETISAVAAANVVVVALPQHTKPRTIKNKRTNKINHAGPTRFAYANKS